MNVPFLYNKYFILLCAHLHHHVSITLWNYSVSETTLSACAVYVSMYM